MAITSSISDPQLTTWDKAAEAYERVRGSEDINTVAASYGITPRALRTRLRKYERARDPLKAATESIVPPAPKPSPSDKPQASAPQSQAVNDVAKLLTPQAVVATIDGLQCDLVATIMTLAKAPPSKRIRDLLPLDPMQKAMLEPWAGFITESIPDTLRQNPKAGLYIFLGLLAWIELHKAAAIVHCLRAERAEANRAKELSGQMRAAEAVESVDHRGH